MTRITTQLRCLPVLIGLATTSVFAQTVDQFHAAWDWVEQDNCYSNERCLTISIAVLKAALDVKEVGDTNWNKFWSSFTQLQIVLAGYDCPSVVHLTPYSTGRGVNFTVDCTRYSFDVKDYGGRWLVYPHS
jgi:hypothetical protein